MKLHMYDHETSGWWVKALITATRTIANTVVMIASANTHISATFFRSDIWTLHIILIGIAITMDTVRTLVLHFVLGSWHTHVICQDIHRAVELQRGQLKMYS